MTETTTAPHPAYGPPLTHSDLSWNYLRTPITWLGEDCDRFMALGHVEPMRMVGAAHALERMQGDGGLDYLFPQGAQQALEAVKHAWAVRRPYCTYDTWERCPQYPDCHPRSETDFPWYIDWNDGITADTPGAFPITLLVP